MFRLALIVSLLALVLSAQAPPAPAPTQYLQSPTADAQRNEISAAVAKNAAAVAAVGASEASSAAAVRAQYLPLLILTACTLLTTLITTVANVWLKSKENAWQVAREAVAEQHREALSESIRKTEANILQLEKNTNSIKDALVKTTGEAERAKGVLEGKADVRNSEA